MAPGKTELPPAIHNITFCGLTGAIFVLLTVALVLYVEGFVTNSWMIQNETFTGLWQTCKYKPTQNTQGMDMLALYRLGDVDVLL